MPKYRYLSDVARALFHRVRRQGEEMELSESQAAQVEAVAPGALVRIDHVLQSQPEAEPEMVSPEEPEAEPVREPEPAPEEVEAAAGPQGEPAVVEPEPVVMPRDEPPVQITTRRRSRK